MHMSRSNLNYPNSWLSGHFFLVPAGLDIYSRLRYIVCVHVHLSVDSIFPASRSTLRVCVCLCVCMCVCMHVCVCVFARACVFLKKPFYVYHIFECHSSILLLLAVGTLRLMVSELAGLTRKQVCCLLFDKFAECLRDLSRGRHVLVFWQSFMRNVTAP